MAENMQIPLFESDLKPSITVGIDEAGRGCLAGPVVIASVGCDLTLLEKKPYYPQLADSKKLSKQRRQQLHDQIFDDSDVTIRTAFLSPFWVDRFNILQATLLGFELVYPYFEPTTTLIDGNQVPSSMKWAKAEVKGDERFPIISAASIVAKVRRDQFMSQMEAYFPGYGFFKHKGYGTAEHLNALKELGPSSLHRKTFRPVFTLLKPNEKLNLDYFSSLDVSVAWKDYMQKYHLVDPKIDPSLFRHFKNKGLVKFPRPKFLKDFT